jgi:hypothetical protein
MKNLHNIFHGIGGISLKLKLLIPFLFFAFASTTILTIISLSSQQNLIKKEEMSLLLQHYRLFLDRLDQKQSQAISIASSFADIPEIGRLLNEDNREALNNYITPIYQNLKENQGISELYLHRPPGIPFLRLYNPEAHADTAGLDIKSVPEIFSGAEKSLCLGIGKAGLVTGALCLSIMMERCRERWRPVYIRKDIYGRLFKELEDQCRTFHYGRWQS